MRFTREQISSDYRLWCEYADPHGTMSRAEFDALTMEEKNQLQADAFGAEPDEPDQE